MSAPTNLTPAEMAAVSAEVLRKHLPLIEAIQRSPLALEVKPTQKEPRT